MTTPQLDNNAITERGNAVKEMPVTLFCTKKARVQLAPLARATSRSLLSIFESSPTFSNDTLAHERGDELQS